MAVSTEERWKEHNETGRRHFERAEFAEAEQAYIAALRQATLLGAVRDRARTSRVLPPRFPAVGELFSSRAHHSRAGARMRVRRAHAGAQRSGGALLFAWGARAGGATLSACAHDRETQLGDLHPDLTVSLSNLARLRQRRADWRAAAPLLGRLLAIKQRALGETRLRTRSRSCWRSRTRAAHWASTKWRRSSCGARSCCRSAPRLGTRTWCARSPCSRRSTWRAGRRSRAASSRIRRRSARSALGACRAHGTHARASTATLPIFRWIPGHPHLAR